MRGAKLHKPKTKPRCRRPGVPCPSCKGEFSSVVRTTATHGTLTRIRCCASCGRRFITREGAAKSDTGVIELATAVDSLNKLLTTRFPTPAPPERMTP